MYGHVCIKEHCICVCVHFIDNFFIPKKCVKPDSFHLHRDTPKNNE